MKLKFKLTSTREDSNGLTLTYRNGYIFTEVTIPGEPLIEMIKDDLRNGHLKSIEFEVVFCATNINGEEEIVAIPCQTATDPDTGVVAWASGWSPDERLAQLQYGDTMRY